MNNFINIILTYNSLLWAINSPPLKSLSYAALDHNQEGWPIHACSLDNKLQTRSALDGFWDFYICIWITFVVLCATVKQSYDASQAKLDNIIEFLEETKKRQKSDDRSTATYQYAGAYLQMI